MCLLLGPPAVSWIGRLKKPGSSAREFFVTNAVKHFKHEIRGKRRLHKRPNSFEIQRCRWWQDLERAIVKPAVIVALGATAARSVLGRPIDHFGKVRGQAISLDDGAKAFVTMHPSALLRIKNQSDKERQYEALVDDLRLASEFERLPLRQSGAVIERRGRVLGAGVPIRLEDRASRAAPHAVRERALDSRFDEFGHVWPIVAPASSGSACSHAIVSISLVQNIHQVTQDRLISTTSV